MQTQSGEIIGVLQLLNRKIKQEVIVNADNALETTQAYSNWEEKNFAIASFSSSNFY